MTWFLAALLAAFAFTGQALSFQQLQKHYPIPVYMMIVRLASASLLALLFLRPPDFAVVLPFLAPLSIAGICSWGAAYAYNRAITTQNNIGYIQAVLGIQTALSYVYSLLFLDASFELARLIGVIVLSSGALLVSGIFQHAPKKTKSAENPQGKFPPAWFLWALLAAVLFTIMTIFVRYTTDSGVESQDALIVILFVTGVLFFVQAGQVRRAIKVNRSQLVFLVAAILCAAVGNVLEFFSVENTPNLAYTIAISNTRMILLYIVGLWLFSEKIRIPKAAGIVLAFAGVMALSL